MSAYWMLYSLLVDHEHFYDIHDTDRSLIEKDVASKLILDSNICYQYMQYLLCFFFSFSL